MLINCCLKNTVKMSIYSKTSSRVLCLKKRGTPKNRHIYKCIHNPSICDCHKISTAFKTSAAILSISSTFCQPYKHALYELDDFQNLGKPPITLYLSSVASKTIQIIFSFNSKKWVVNFISFTTISSLFSFLFCSFTGAPDPSVYVFCL